MAKADPTQPGASAGTTLPHVPKTKMDHAQAHAAAGFYVFPLVPNGKTPLIKGLDFRTESTRDADQICKWWTENPDANIGISTSRYKDDKALVVVDVDVKDGKDGEASLRQIECGNFLPLTLESATTTAGRHLIFSADKPTKQGANVLGRGLDIRSRGGYIVAAGSTIGDKVYVASNKRPVAQAPDWLIKLIGEAGKKTDANRNDTPPKGLDENRARDRAVEYLKARAPIGEQGGRNDTGFRVACELKDLGAGEPEAVELMLEHWNCEPMLDLAELKHVVHSAYKYGESRRGIKDAGTEFDPVGPKQQPATETEKPERRFKPLKLTEMKLSGAQGTLVHEWINRGELVALIGAPSAGKSYFATQLSFAVASGNLDFFQCFTTHGPVLYVAAERALEQNRRFRALCQIEGVDPDSIPLRVLPHPVLMRKKEDVADLILAAKDLESEFGEPLALVVIDTIGRCLPGIELNASGDANAFGAYLEQVRAETGATVLCVAHTPKDKRKTVLGSTQYDGIFDTIMYVDKDDRLLEHTKNNTVCGGIEQKAYWTVESTDVTVEGEDLTVARFTPSVRRMDKKPLKGNAGKVFSALQTIAAGGQGATMQQWKEEVARTTGKEPKRVTGMFTDVWEKIESRITEDDGLYLPVKDGFDD